MMKIGVIHNNKACVLIKVGCSESAITYLHKALLNSFHSHRRHLESQKFNYLPCSHMHENRNRRISSHDHQSSHYYPEDDYDEGMRTFSQPFHICNECDDTYYGSTEATVFFNLGIAYARIGDEPEALVYFQKSLEFQHIIKSMFGEESSNFFNGPALHVILHNIGHLHWKSGRYTEAINSYSQALEYLSNDRPDLLQSDLSSTLNCIAVSMFYAGEQNTGDILTIFEKALALRLGSLAPRAGYDRESATIINNCGRVRYLRGEFAAAFKVYNEAYNQRIAALGEDHIDVAASLCNMAQAKEYQGHALEAIDLYKQFVEKISDKKGMSCIDVIKALVTIGQLYYNRDDLEQAHFYFLRALDSAKTGHAPHSETIAIILNQIGRIRFHQSKFDLALEAFSSGLTVERMVYHKFHARIAMTLVDIARVKQHQGDLDQCLQLYTEALEIVRHDDDEREAAKILIDLALIHEKKGDIDDAIRVLQEAVASLVKENSRNDSLLPSSLNILGLLRHKQGSFTLALCSFQEAIKIYRSFEEIPTPDIAAVYQNAATVCRKIGEPDMALHYYLSSLRLEMNNSQGSNSNNEHNASLYYEIGMIFNEREEFDEALSYLNQSSRMCKESATETNDSLAGKVFMALADVYLQKGDTEMAMQSLTSGMEIRSASEIIVDRWNFNSVGDSKYSYLYQILCKTNPPAAGAA